MSNHEVIKNNNNTDTNNELFSNHLHENNQHVIEVSQNQNLRTFIVRHQYNKILICCIQGK